MKFTAQAKEGRIAMGEYTRADFVNFLKANDGCRLEITPVLPESGKLRRYFEGCLVPLITFYQEKLDHRSYEDCQIVREFLKQEFNGEMVVINGRTRRIAKSTKGRKELNNFVERVIDWLVENYAPPAEAMDPNRYKNWRDVIYPNGGPETYIGYLVEIGILQVPGSHAAAPVEHMGV